MITVLLVDDEPMVCEHLQTIIGSAPDMEVIGAVHDGPAAVEATAAQNPDVVLMDLRMPGGGGIEAIQQIRHRQLPNTVVVLTMIDHDDMVAAAVRAGANGFLTKSTPALQLIDLIRMAARGHGVLSGDGLSRLATGLQAVPTTLPGGDTYQLTDRESDVLQHLAAGQSNSAIAQALFLSEATVKGHVSRIHNYFMLFCLPNRAMRAAWLRFDWPSGRKARPESAHRSGPNKSISDCKERW